MTKKEAIRLLIAHAAKNCVGAGQGPGHRVPSEAARRMVAHTIVRVWPESWPIGGNDLWNLGLPNVTAE